MTTPIDRSSLSQLPLKTAVVGLGRIGFGYHAPAIVDAPGFEFTAVVDPLESRGAEATAKWGVPSFVQLDDLFAQCAIDLVVIASPTPFHCPQTLACFAAGTHVVCDKPATSSVANFDQMVAAATLARRHLIIYQPARFEPEILTLKDILRRGVLGRVHTVTRHRGNFNRRNDWQARQSQSGGMLNNYGSHGIDEILWLLDSPEIQSVYCRTDIVHGVGDADDHTHVLLRSTTRVSINITCSQAKALVPHPWQVHGSNGSAIWHEAEQEWRMRYFDPATHPTPTLQTGFAATDRAYQTETINWVEEIVPTAQTDRTDFYTAVQNSLVRGIATPVTLTESRSLLEVIERCRHSAASGEVA